MDQYFDFTPKCSNKPCSCSITSDHIGISNGYDFEYFQITNARDNERMVELGVKNPDKYKRQVLTEIQNRLLFADDDIVTAARHFSPELFKKLKK